MAAMFSNVRPSNTSSGNILEFKAGRSNLEAGSAENMRKVVADPKKGLVYVKQSNDMLTHFCWKDRETGAVIDDLIIFPDDAEFKEVKGCPDGKVYMLKFKSSKDMRLYWLQDGSPDAEKDLVKKVNDALNKPPTQRQTGRSGNADRSTAGGLPSNMPDVRIPDFGGPLGGLDQSQLLSLIQSLQSNNTDPLPTPPVPSSNAPSSETDCEPTAKGTASGTGSNFPSLSTNDLSEILNNLRPAEKKEKKKKVQVSLSDAISTETAVETAKQNADKLVEHLPESSSPQKELSDTIRTPQFRQATDVFGHALQTGQLAPVLSQFGLTEPTILSAANGDLLGFAKNLTIAEGGELPPDEEADDSTKEPEAKRNRPDLDDMETD